MDVDPYTELTRAVIKLKEEIVELQAAIIALTHEVESNTAGS